MKDLKIYYERNSMFPGHDGVFCKTNPDITFVDKNVAFLSYTMLKMNGSDTFYDEFCVKSTDGGNITRSAICDVWNKYAKWSICSM